MISGVGTFTKEDMKNSIKMRNYYVVTDVRMVLEDEDFEGYSTDFLQYMLAVLAPGKKYGVPWGDKMEDATLESVIGEWTPEYIRDKVSKFLTVLVDRLTQQVVVRVKNEGAKGKINSEEFNAIEMVVYRLWGSGEEGTRKLNQYIVQFIRKITDSSDKNTAYGINRHTQFLWQRYYDSRYDI